MDPSAPPDRGFPIRPWRGSSELGSIGAIAAAIAMSLAIAACTRDCPEEEATDSLAGVEQSCPELLAGTSLDGGVDAGPDADPTEGGHLTTCPSGPLRLELCERTRSEVEWTELVRQYTSAEGETMCTYRFRAKPGNCNTGSFW